jgi:hypothetical protein
MVAGGSGRPVCALEISNGVDFAGLRLSSRKFATFLILRENC